MSSCSLLHTFLFAAGVPRIPMTAPQFRAQRPLAMWSYVEFILEQISWMAVQSNVWNYEMIWNDMKWYEMIWNDMKLALSSPKEQDWSKMSKSHEKGPVNHMKANVNLIILCKRAGLLLHLPSKIIKVKKQTVKPQHITRLVKYLSHESYGKSSQVPTLKSLCGALYDIVWLYDVICPA